jgi:hypothetical protein
MRLRLVEMGPRCTVIFVLILFPAASLGQSEAASLPAGTPLALAIDQHYAMRAGEPIRAHLLYPVYADNKLVIPANTIVTGSVVDLRADRSRRVRAMLGGDFTPFRTPEVRFTHILLTDGTSIPFRSDVATKGTQIYRAVSPPPAKGGVLWQQFNAGLTVARSDLAAFIAPGKGDRLLQFIYSQIPYHPQRIEKGTSWTIETSVPIEVPIQPETASSASASPTRRPHFWEPQVATPPTPDAGAWIIQANLEENLSSETSTKGQSIRATVAEPIYNEDHTVAIPQGATLIGTVSRAQPARKFGRTGVLSFNFTQLAVPEKEMQTVETKLTGADSAQDIALSSEGQAKSKARDKIAIPLLLAVMASRPLDQDCGHRGGCNTGASKNGVGGAAGLGLIGTVIGIAGGSPNVAAGIGYWGAARAIYSRWIARGQKIAFAKDTRIVVETTPRRSAPIKPDTEIH